MKLQLLLILMCFGSLVKAQQNYAIDLIPKELLSYASAVVRNEEIVTEVKDLDNVSYHLKRAVTVLNKNGEDIAHMVIFYNKNVVVKSLKGVVYNEFGKSARKFSEKDFSDQSAAHDFSLFEDSRVKHYIPAITEFPYTIEYEYELKIKQSLDFDDWTPITDDNEALEKGSYQFICKPDFKIRFKQINFPGKASVITNPAGLTMYNWKVENMKAVREESFSPSRYVVLPRVTIAPEKFLYAGVSGSFTNWKQMGEWMNQKLLAARDELSPETMAYVKELTKDIVDPKQKAKKIYEYMQHKTRYISIQIGIGGFQPFLASDVDRLNYGDCKALVNYTKALLGAAGIASYYCIVYGNSKEKISLLKDFTSMQGNHAILCLPLKNDTTWMECTSQTLPFGYLGSFTDDRTVLACTPDGGKLMHTPKYPANNNVESRKATFVIDDKGELTGNMITNFKGLTYEDREEVIDDAPVERVKDIKRIYPINNLEVESLEYKQDKSLIPVTEERIKLQARDYASLNDGKIFFMLNPANRLTRAPAKTSHRINDIDINHGYTEEDEITYTLPAGYHLDSRNIDISINKSFGKFSAKSTLTGNKLTYKRTFQLLDGEYSKDIYPDLLDFYSDIIDADSNTVELVKN